jgi:membrane-associated phospholipid phosphatase
MTSLILATNFIDKLWHWLDTKDKIAFVYVNNIYTNTTLDSIFPWWRDGTTWLPLYLFLVVFMFLNYKNKAWVWMLFAMLTVILSDQISSGFLKNWVNRPRPCQDMVMQYYTHLRINYCPKSGSFTSSHATNHFAAAMFIFLTLKPVLKKYSWLFFMWAGTISYGQVYVGVHYPLDVLCGAMLGCLIGWASASFFKRRLGLPNLEIE